MIINQVVRISDNAFHYYWSRGVDIISKECERVGYLLAWEMSIITYRTYTWKAVQGYRIQGDPALWIRIDVSPVPAQMTEK